MSKLKSITLNKTTLQVLSMMLGGLGFLCQIASSKVGDALSDIEINELIELKLDERIAEVLMKK